MPVSNPAGRRAERTLLGVLLAASFLLYCVYSAATPLFEASDELWHYPMVQTLAAGNGLPVQRKGQTDAEAPWRQEGSQPPLYYAFAALASAPFDASNWRDLRRINPHADMGVPTRDGNANAVLHTVEEAFPWQRAALAVRAARLVSIIMSTLTVLFAYLVAAELFHADGAQGALLRLGAATVTAATPMFAFISGAVNNDNAAVLFSTIGVWWALRLLRTGALTWKNALVAGLLAACAALSKVSGMGLLGLFGAAAVLAVWVRRDDTARPWSNELARAGGYVAVMVVATLALSGWWFARNAALYGDVLGWNAFLDVVGRRDTPATLAQLWSEREGFAWAYWGVFGTLNVIFPPWLYAALNALAALGLAGCVLGTAVWGRRVISSRPRPPGTRLRLSQALLCAFYVALIFVGLVRWTTLTPASQGRLMFPAISILSVMMAYGLWRIHRWLLAGSLAGLVALAVMTPFVVIAPAYARPVDAWSARLPTPISTTFGDAIELVEASAPALTVAPGGEVDLALNWRLLRPVPRNFSVFVHLVDENDVIVAQRDMYPGQGNLALAETPAPYAWSDRYTLRISQRAPAPRELRWRVGLYDATTGERLKTAPGLEYVDFGKVRLAPGDARGPLLTYANGAQLAGYDLQAGAARPGSPFTVTLRTRADTPPDGQYNISLQLIDDAARKVAQQDFSFPPGLSGVTHALNVAADAPPGVYRLLLVVYRPVDGFPRVGAYDAGGQFAGDQIELAKVRVRAP